jgi:hypothetical protein
MGTVRVCHLEGNSYDQQGKGVKNLFYVNLTNH